jgi:hypothetical protein
LRRWQNAKLVTPQKLQAAARRRGLKLTLDRYHTREAGSDQYILRPIWDARRAVRLLPDGSCELIRIWDRENRTTAMLPLDMVTQLLAGDALAHLLKVPAGDRPQDRA